MFKNYLKIAFRGFIRHKSMTLINTFGLAIGMAVCILLLLWVQDEMSYDNFHRNGDNLYRVIQVGVWNDGETYGSSTIPYSLAPVMQEDYPEIADHVRLRTLGGRMMQVEDKTYFEDILLTEPSLFKMFSFEMLIGDPQVALEEIHSIILTEDTAHKYFGDEDPMGRIIRFNDNIDFTVTGIAANPPQNSSIIFNMIIPFEILGEERITGWSWESSGYVQLQEETDLASFSEKIVDTIVRHRPDNENTVLLQPLDKVHLYNPLGHAESLIFVLIFAAIGIIVLLIACINFMNLTTARSAKRAREVGIRKVVGADKKQLIGQFLSESILLAFISLIIAFVLVELFLPAFNQLAGKELSVEPSNITFLLSLIGITLFVGIVSGSYPALYLSRFKPNKVLKSGNAPKTKNKFRTVLVVFQFTISIALIICTATVYNQLNYVQNKDLGYTKDYIVTVPTNAELRESFTAFKEELGNNTNILGVTNASTSPAFVGNVNPAIWEGKVDDETILFNFYLAEYEFLDVFELELVAGENFRKEYMGGDEIPYIVNETAVKLMQLKDPIGKRFAMYNEDNQGIIIGVVKDYHFQTLTNEIGPIMITTLDWWRGEAFIKINPNNVTETLGFIEETFNKFAPSFQFQYSFLDEDIDELYHGFYEMGSIIKYFAILAIFISCLGLFGLASFMTEQRTKEIGIRKVLGSSISAIVMLLSRGFAKWVLLGNFIAWPIAYYAMNRFLQMFAYRAELNIWLFIISGLLALIIALVTVGYRTIKAANSNPVEALKYE
ncbi:MAG: ABC transporter permease [Armatimonadetes bacterium]|nr:ABC transporter permease [Armatimonadota bacterium]